MSRLVHNRDGLEVAYNAALTIDGVKEFLPENFTLDEMKKNLADWDVFSVIRNEEIIGIGILKDKEIHFCIVPKYHGIWLTKGLLESIFALDFEFTSVAIDNKPKQRFVERLGFLPVETIDGNIIYKLEEF